MSTAAHRLAERFVDHDGTYLLSHSIGLPVRGSREAATSHFDTWEHHTADAWPRWFGGLDGFRSALAGVLHTDARSICPQSNVSSGLTKLLASIGHEFREPTVLISEDAFPSLGFVCERSDYAVRFLPNGADLFDPSMWSEHFAGVDVAVITHVHSNTGQCLPVAEISAAARAAGVMTVVDVAQSVGIIPIDVGAWRADAVVGSCVKWLSGGPGAGWLWVADDALQRCRPTDVGWFSHEAPFEFDIRDYRDAPDVSRFWGGSPSVLPFLIAAHAIETIDDIGVDEIREHNLALTDHLIARLGERVTSPHDRERRGGTAIVAGDESVVVSLEAEDFGVDHRAGGVRVSPHVHTTVDDIDRFVSVIDRL